MLMTKETDPLRRAERLKDLSDQDLREAIAGVLANHPDLTMSGFGVASDVTFERHLLRPEAVAQTRRALRWLSSDAVTSTADVDRRRTSYGLKHAAERWGWAYVSNGS